MPKSDSSTKYFSSKQEKLVADLLGWSVVPGSGARSLYPGDVESPEWLGECKTHEKPGHKITFYTSVWNKICEEAISKYRFAALFVDDGSQTVKHTWVMFNTLPGIPHEVVDFTLKIKTNVSFDSLDMLMDRRTRNIAVPIIYKITTKDYPRIRYLSTLEDFNLMFGSK